MRRGRKLESHYRSEAGYHLIEIRLPALRNLFNSLDPSPFHDKDLDAAAERYIVESVKEFPLNSPLKLIFHLPDEAKGVETERELREAVHNYFEYSYHAADRQLRQTLGIGRTSLYIGLGFLFLCIIARQAIASMALGVAGEIVQEGLLISGWVAMWRPIQIFLYDWWPIQRQKAICWKIAQLPIEIR